MDKIRIGIIGMGNMGRGHARAITNGQVPGAELTAVCDAMPEGRDWAKDNLGDGIRRFDDAEELYKAGIIDAIIIATPHFDHPPMAMKAFEKDLHVMIEKPAGVDLKPVREMNEAAVKSGKVFGIMYNQRTNPMYQKLRQLIQSGELGEIKRTNWIITNWYRTQAYYDSGRWRATWAGEGGGVLLNQCPHQLDIWQWICGMPSKVMAFMGIGKYHDIEVEDDVTAYVEYPNGASGIFIASTGEAPGTNRFEIMGDKGKAVVEDGNLSFWQLKVSERQFNSECKDGFGSPECWKCEIPINGVETSHPGILRDWVDAILKGEPLLAPGIEGINGLSLSAAMYLSHWKQGWVDLPVNEQEFHDWLQERISTSRGR